MNFELLSKSVSHALRHEPWLYELELDEDGWVDKDALLAALRKERADWSTLTAVDLASMIEQSEKRRHEIDGTRMRALYGHSTPHKLLKTPGKPPAVLYHGTAPDTAAIIRREGLRPMGRQYVHLSSDVQTARQVGARKATIPEILMVLADVAYAAGIRFYNGNEHVWLADYVPPDFIATAHSTAK